MSGEHCVFACEFGWRRTRAGAAGVSVGAIAVAPSRAVSPKQVGIAGIVLAAIAWVITIPPIEVRGMVPSIVLAVVAVCAGAWSIAGGERKLGSEAIVVALFAVAGAAASANSAVVDARVSVHLVGAGGGDAPLCDAAAVRGARWRDLRVAAA